ncbi:M14 family metallopeptidase [Microcystis aeruginosa]|nr:murein peptide amidase A [Microcystis aeruginosa]
MNRHLPRQQEHLIPQKVKTGKYQSPENHPLIDGETFITEIIHRFQPMGD